MGDTLSILLPILGTIGVAVLLRLILPGKGKVGEKVVANRLDKLPPEKYVVLNDVIIPTKSGTTQIDHIVISIYGVFVIETKFYKGWIYGGENSEYWTQNIYGNKYQLYNPILQNGGHVRALKRVLDEFGGLPTIPIVAFSGQADLKVNVTNAHVVYWRQVRSVINRYQTQTLSWDQVQAIRRKIEEVRLSSKEKEVRKRQKASVRNAKAHKQYSVASGRCPRCGGKLVLREGRYGKFYGCSNYPKCTYTHE